jgi:hypothetical protein
MRRLLPARALVLVSLAARADDPPHRQRMRFIERTTSLTVTTKINKLFDTAAYNALKSGFKTLAPVDFTGRVITKGFIRLFTTVFGKRATRIAVRLNLNDERVVNHMDE